MKRDLLTMWKNGGIGTGYRVATILQTEDHPEIIDSLTVDAAKTSAATAQLEGHKDRLAVPALSVTQRNQAEAYDAEAEMNVGVSTIVALDTSDLLQAGAKLSSGQMGDLCTKGGDMAAVTTAYSDLAQNALDTQLVIWLLILSAHEAAQEWRARQSAHQPDAQTEKDDEDFAAIDAAIAEDKAKVAGKKQKTLGSKKKSQATVDATHEDVATQQTMQAVEAGDNVDLADLIAARDHQQKKAVAADQLPPEVKPGKPKRTAGRAQPSARTRLRPR